jgi:acetylornithine deacetylase/succinyl-diaminopimelate desuccinylase-like protein
VDPERLADAVASGMPAARRDLERLVRIPSIAFPGYPRAPLDEAAAATVEILRDAGLADAHAVEPAGGGPAAVFAHEPGPPGAPTVLLYAHYDVQPSGPERAWSSPPFEPVLRDGRLYARGAADDKSGVVMHAAALRALNRRAPVTLKVVIEGEEEVGTDGMERLLAAEPERFAADVVVVADSGNWTLGEPTLTTSLRGLVVCDVEVRALERPVHSGIFGGAAPDALQALIRLLDTLLDDRGAVAVQGLERRAWDGLEQDEQSFRGAAGVLPGVRLIGEGTIAERVFTRPAVTVIGLDAPAVDGAQNALVPRARARVSLRLSPGDDPARARAALADHLRAAAPWGVAVEVTPSPASADGFLADTTGPGYRAALSALERAYGKPAVKLGSGGSIPLVTLLDRALPDAEIVIWGAEDPGANIHSADEGVDLTELERAIHGQAAFLLELGP